MKVISRIFAKSFSNQINKASGFSIIEIVIVMIIIGILGAISIPYIYNYRKLYKSEEQAIILLDLMKETNQYALTRRRTFRFEIDVTNNSAIIIDENGPGTADDRQIKAIPLEAPGEIKFDQPPTGLSGPSPPNYPNAAFATVAGRKIWSARFQSDGSVINALGNPVSATIFVWAPSKTDAAIARNLSEVRAITVFGGSGAVRYWKHNGTTFKPN